MAQKMDIGKFEDYAGVYTLGEMIANYMYLAGQYNKLVSDYDKIEEQLFNVQCQLDDDRQTKQESMMFRDGLSTGW